MGNMPQNGIHDTALANRKNRKANIWNNERGELKEKMKCPRKKYFL